MSTLRTIAERVMDAVVHPTVRLKASTEFPLTGVALGKAYLVGFLLFMAGSTIPVLLFIALITGLAYYAPPETTNALFKLIFVNNADPSPFLLGTMMIASFLGGFALEMRYLRGLLHKKGCRLRDVVGLSIGPMRGRNWLATFWNIAWRAVLIFGATLAIEQTLDLFVHVPEQPTIEYARKLTGGSAWMFVVLAAGMAPVLEEFCFRGILFQAMRATFHGYRAAAEGSTSGKSSRFGRWMGRVVLKTAGRADFAAVLGSAFVFALWHLQFHPVHLLLLTGMGCVFAETFRRTGTLWTSIAVHALNNGFMALLLMYGS